MDHFGAVNIDSNTSISEDSEHDMTEFFSPESSCSELFSTASASSAGMEPKSDDANLNLEEFDKNLPHTVTLLRAPNGARVYLVGTGHFSVESQNDVSKVMQAVKPHILVVELCTDRASVMQMDEEAILNEARDFSYEKLKSIFKEAGVLQGIIYVLLLKLSAGLTKNHGIAPGGEFRRALKEMEVLKRCYLIYGDRPLRITIKRALAKLSWRQSISLFFALLFSKTDMTAEEIEKYKQKDIIEEMMAKLVTDYPDVSEVFINERDIYLTHSLQVAAEHPIPFIEKGRTANRVVGIVGIGHCPGISRLWGTVQDSAIPPLLVIPEPTKSDIIIKKTMKYGFLCLAVVGVYYIVPFPKSLSSPFKSTYSAIVSKVRQTARVHIPYQKLITMEDSLVDDYDHVDPSIFYTPNNIPGKGCDRSAFDSHLYAGCTCSAECNDLVSCACVRSQGLNYENKKLIDSKLLDEGSVLECNDECCCSSNCGNRVTQFGPTTGLQIIKCTGKGYAITTSRRLSKGEFVCEYAGEVIGVEEATARRKHDRDHNYIFSLNEFVAGNVLRTVVDATRIGNIGRYINHSCQPNCKVVPVRVDSAVPKLAIFAGRDIDANEELTYSYGDSDAIRTDDEGKLKACLCGAVACKKFLPHDL